MTTWRERSERIAMNIVHQIGDALYEALPPDVAHEHFVTARQQTNDVAIDFAMKLIDQLLTAQREAILALGEGLEKETGMFPKATRNPMNAALDAYQRAIKDMEV